MKYGYQVTDGVTPNKIEFKGVTFTFTHDGTKATLDLSPEFLNGEELLSVVRKFASDPTFSIFTPDELRDQLIVGADRTANTAVANQIANDAKAVVAPTQAPITPATAPVKNTPKGTLTKFSILGRDNRFNPANANPKDSNVYYGVDEEGDVFMIAPESKLPTMLYDFKAYIGGLYTITIPKAIS